MTNKLPKKLGKTEERILAKLKSTNYARISYDGYRETRAVEKLHARGLVVQHKCDGTYFARSWDGSARRGYHPQGYVTVA